MITVLTFPSIANFDDLDPLAAEPDVQLRYLAPGEALPADTRVVILPGSKATRADLAFLRAQGWDIDLLAHVRRGGFVVGLCGGYQMLGREVRDPTGQEASGEESTAGSTSGSAGSTRGLGLLEITTTLEGTKTLARVEGRHVPSGAPIAGYEIHLGRTEGPDTARPVARLQSGQAPVGQRNVVTRTDGAISADGRIWGSYVHGLFASDQLRRACLATWGAEADETLAFEPRVEAALDALADAVEAHLDVAALLAIAGQ